jgi:hypothetical protein
VIQDPRTTKDGTIEHTLEIHNDDTEESIDVSNVAVMYSDTVAWDITGLEEYTDTLEGAVLNPGDSLVQIIEEHSCIVGDANSDGAIDIDDVVFLINYIFAGGPEAVPYESGDANCSGVVDIDDVVYLINYIFAGGPEPGLTCDCGYRGGRQGAGHVYGTFTIEDDRGDVKAIVWIDHPTD